VIAAGTSRELFEPATNDPYVIAARAYVWGFAPILAARLREAFTNPKDPFAPRNPALAGAPLNNLGHQRRLADATVEVGVAPNVDTLYTLSWLDLAEEPFVLETPDFGSRFYTFQMGYGDTATEFSLGRRTHGSELPPVLVAGPSHHESAPEGMLHVRCPTRYFLLAGRILVRPDDPASYEAVYELQSQIRLRTLSRYRAAEDGPNPVPEQRLLDEGSDSIEPDLVPLNQLGNMLREWIPRADERPLVGSFARLGVTREHGFRPDTLPHTAKAEVARGLAEGVELVDHKTRNLGENVNGWTINYLGPRFGDDYLLRAAVAKDQIYVTVPEEALYPVAKGDAGGEPLSGEHAYRIRFPPAQLPPVDGFWSLTMYTANGGPLVANPIDRYAIGDRTPGLVAEGDGALTIRIQRAPPAHGSPVNWLPAPAGPFHLMLRLYIPRAGVLDRSWFPPPVERTVDV
jgi:hypothetical protein